MTPESFDLDSDPATVTVEAAYSKRRRRDVLPLRADLAEILRDWMEGRGGNLWPGRWYERAAEMLREDLARADIPYEDRAGAVFDFHALRHQFLTNLQRAGVHPKTAQALVRHPTITLTMDRYTHEDSGQMVEALSTLPELTKWTENLTEGSVPLRHGGASDGTQDDEEPSQQEAAQVDEREDVARDPNLQAVIEKWPELNAVAKAGIMAMVRAASAALNERNVQEPDV